MSVKRGSDGRYGGRRRFKKRRVLKEGVDGGNRSKERWTEGRKREKRISANDK